MIEFISEFTGLAAGVVRGMLVGGLVCLCASLLGTTLVLKRFSMIGDGLSHVAFGAMAVAAAFGASPLWVSVPIVVAAAFLLLRFCGGDGVKGDSAVALIATTSLAIGITTIKFAGSNVSINNYMFGSIVAVGEGELAVCLPMCAVIILAFVFLYNRVFTVTFDEDFAKASGMKTSLYNGAIALLTALTIVIGMKIMGTLLISGLIIFPSMSAMKLFGSFKKVVISSAVISMICFALGLVSSVGFDTPVGAGVIIANAIVFTSCSLSKAFSKKK